MDNANVGVISGYSFADIWEDITERYAKVQTQELQEHNANLANNLLEMSNSLVELIKENDNLKDLSNTITGIQLQEQNAELVEMYKECFEMFIPSDKWDEATEFLSTYGSGLAKDLCKKEKYNHLNKKP